jgi:hypothetical protein
VAAEVAQTGVPEMEAVDGYEDKSVFSLGFENFVSTVDTKGNDES